jgi:hypothetical protein
MESDPADRKTSPQTAEPDDVKQVLVTKYRKIFIDKLSRKDLEELQYYLQRQFTENRTINMDYKAKFESKLRAFFPEEILRKEIVSIEVLLNRLGPEDLKDQSG